MTDERTHCGESPSESSGNPGHCDVRVVDAERVSAVRDRLPGAADTETVTALFRMLGDPSRCLIMHVLVEAGEICVCDIAASLGLSESNVSHHLGVLRAHGLVRPRREGKRMLYSPDDLHVRLLLDLAREHARHGPVADQEPATNGRPA